MTDINPFTERTRIINATRFAGRWGELSQVFERLEASKPILISGAPGVGKSSLLTHIVQSAGSTMNIPELRSYYIDLGVLPNVAEFYRLVTTALGGRGATLAALDLALVEIVAPALFCLDNVDRAIAAGWGERLLEDLARLSRGHALLLVAAISGPVPLLSERFAVISLGAYATAELRLLTDAYLDETSVRFTPGELRLLGELSAGHPAYLQRAAYQLFRSRFEPELDWRAAYLEEAAQHPIPGSPLPPQVFEGATSSRVEESVYGAGNVEDATAAPNMLIVPRTERALLAFALLALGILLIAMWWQNVLLLLGGLALAGFGLFLMMSEIRRSRSKQI